MKHNYNSRQVRRTRNRKKYVIALAVALVVAAFVIGTLELTNTTHLLHTQKASSGTIPTKTTPKTTSDAAKLSTRAKGEAPTPNTDVKAGSVGAQTGGGAPAATSGAGPVAPYGTLVSNHQPSLSSNERSNEVSACSTTPGATCSMQFTSGGITKTLPSQTADGSGLVSWSWNVKDAGFTEGTWKITATATLNGQTKSTTDGNDLVVQP